MLYFVVFCVKIRIELAERRRIPMKLFYNRNSKDPIYYIQHGFRNGKKTSTRNVKRIGKHSELLAITEDPLAYAKEQVRLYNEEYQKGKVKFEMPIDFQEKVQASGEEASPSTLRNIGYLFLQQIYKQLDLASFFSEITKDTKITFDANTVNRFLTFSRILWPCSKRRSCTQFSNYYEEPKISYQHVLRFMDLLYPHAKEYLEHLFQASKKVVKRDTSICYLDCTNFYFETEANDLDYIDEVTGEFKRGLRRYGVSKEHRPNPLVQMGLFMDRDGIPLTMSIRPGSEGETLCALPMEEELLKMFQGKKFIYCSDGGLGSYEIRKFNSMGMRSFVVTQSIKKLSDPLKAQVFTDRGFRLLSSDQPIRVEALKSMDKFQEKELYEDVAYKFIPADHLVDLGLYETKIYKNGHRKMVQAKGNLKQNLLVTFSRKTMEYQRYIRSQQVKRAEQKIAAYKKDPQAVKATPNDVKRFIKRISVARPKDEPSKGRKQEATSKSKNKVEMVVEDRYELDTERIQEEAKYDGYYCLATNLEDTAKEILAVNASRYQIEDCFRLLKSSFDARPVYHQNEDRIKTHFLLCYTALLIYRLLEKKLKDKYAPFTPAQILDTLRNMNVTSVQDMYYMATYKGSEVLNGLNASFGLNLDRKYYQPKELNKLK